ncbi:uncharacterized protein PHACADRAFT_213165 [Phanerochaete carnosa HHB-10118-sp]|uniref:MYND-type domain-containing protein n=1 Tax=Phanerochaete carnosa (strain HHB-10118-sp) TaxID=650164 RepID=K5VX16_PHACS|nr:uncharacterized protein PHACADRAFT_213165 [Phanerochaete carnosa HHB-10118-sp]EKM51315.1 hypothetical protein PHACADRAFT_213165 [Phanerochaete carnosa HHB-10118-sp]
MSSSCSSLQELSDALSRLSTKDDKTAEVIGWIERRDSKPPLTSLHHPVGGNASGSNGDPVRNFIGTPIWATFLAHHGLSDTDVAYTMLRKTSEELPQFLPLSAPCAYANPAKADECPNPGLQVCSGCRLVKYCSKECQHKHWKIHALDCKARIRSEQWQPAWIEERRLPTFMTGEPGMHPLSRGLRLWGAMPPTDILKLPDTDAKSLSDLNLIFIASGDLRNVLKTVNGLSRDYVGRLTVVMNDRESYVTLRNILILQILAKLSNKRKAADLALHLWYSAFIPATYHSEILPIGEELATGTGFLHTQLGPKAVLDADISQDLRTLCGALMTSSKMYGMGDAANELGRVRSDPDRIDIRHRYWNSCEPSHRLALLEHNHYGIVLPFGAHNTHFNSPNRFLFSPCGEWLQDDGANPLYSWNIEEVIESGKAHGTTREDLYGCLYYHVTSQLQTFAERLARMDISIKIANMDAIALATSIRRGDLMRIGIPEEMRFDRIDASNLVDQDYLGIPSILDAWGGFLKRRDDATIVGHFMNWPVREPGAWPSAENMKGLVGKLVNDGKITPPDRSKMHTRDDMRGTSARCSYAFTAAYHDNSKAFEAHLTKQGLAAALKKAGLKRRLKHEIVPHRLYAPLDGTPSALPDFKDKESWYLQSSIAAPMWTERYIEIVPA